MKTQDKLVWIEINRRTNKHKQTCLSVGASKNTVETQQQLTCMSIHKCLTCGALEPPPYVRPCDTGPVRQLRKFQCWAKKPFLEKIHVEDSIRRAVLSSLSPFFEGRRGAIPWCRSKSIARGLYCLLGGSFLYASL